MRFELNDNQHSHYRYTVIVINPRVYDSAARIIAECQPAETRSKHFVGTPRVNQFRSIITNGLTRCNSERREMTHFVGLYVCDIHAYVRARARSWFRAREEEGVSRCCNDHCLQSPLLSFITHRLSE